MPDARQNTLWRLRCAEGHLHAVTNMLEAGCDCQKALTQLSAVRAAIDAIAMRLLDEQVELCRQVIHDDPSPQRRSEELGYLVALLNTWQKSNLNANEIQMR